MIFTNSNFISQCPKYELAFRFSCDLPPVFSKKSVDKSICVYTFQIDWQNKNKRKYSLSTGGVYFKDQRFWLLKCHRLIFASIVEMGAGFCLWHHEWKSCVITKSWNPILLIQHFIVELHQKHNAILSEETAINNANFCGAPISMQIKI